MHRVAQETAAGGHAAPPDLQQWNTLQSAGALLGKDPSLPGFEMKVNNRLNFLYIEGFVYQN